MKGCRLLILTCLALISVGCSSPPPILPTTTDQYSLTLHAKSGLNAWSKTLNQGLCRLDIQVAMEKAYTESAAKLDSKPYGKITLRDNNQENEFTLSIQYDAESSKVLLFLVNEPAGGEFLTQTVKLGQPFKLNFTPQAQGDINIGFSPVTDSQEMAGQAGSETAKVAEQTYHAFPGFKVQTLVLEGLASDMLFSTITIESGCQPNALSSSS